MKKIVIAAITLMFLGALVIALINIKQVKYVYGSQNQTKTKIVIKGKFLEEPNIVLDENHVIEGWYSDPEFTKKWIFSSHKVFKNVKLYAKLLSILDGQIFRGDELVADFVYEEINEYNPVVIGYQFKGLFLDEQLETKLTENLTSSDKGIVLYEKWEIKVEELPIMTIDLEDTNLEDVDRETYINSSISLFNTDSEFEFYDLEAGFRGRGNSSWEQFDKKGFKIKFDKKQGLFGQTKNKHWVIVPESYDQSLSKNTVAYTIANQLLDSIEYTTKSHHIEVYINGNYHGIYLLLEHRRVGEGRVDIDSEHGILDTGYLLEYDARANEGDVLEGVDYFYVDGLKHPFELKSPDPEDFAKENLTEAEFRAQVFYIKSFMEQAVSAILSGDYEAIDELVDIPSLVDIYLLNEYVKNFDSGWSSQYMYKKPGGKLYFGPAWDFDLSGGSNYHLGLSNPKGFYVGKLSTQKLSNVNEMFHALMKKEWFETLVKARVLQLEDDIRLLIENIYDDIFSYEEAFVRNSLRWPDLTKSEIEPSLYLEEQEKAKQWYLTRLDWFVDWANK